MLDAYCRLVSCLARSAAASADLELDALLLLRGAIAVRDKNNTATIFECEADCLCVETLQFIRRDISSHCCTICMITQPQLLQSLEHRNVCVLTMYRTSNWLSLFPRLRNAVLP